MIQLEEFPDFIIKTGYLTILKEISNIPSSLDSLCPATSQAIINPVKKNNDQGLRHPLLKTTVSKEKNT